jgi:N6-adenosine-specific RNA methylase IME4
MSENPKKSTHSDDQDDEDSSSEEERAPGRPRKKKKQLNMKEVNQSLIEANRGVERNIIYCDPPWHYGDTRVGSVSSHYDTMSESDLSKLNISEIAAKDCFLLMWTTSTQIPSALRLIEAWGFKYVTVWAVWVKCNPDGTPSSHQTGKHTRQQAEFILLGKRGKTDRFMRRRSVWIGNVVMEKRGEHSQKPRIFKDMIEKLYEDVPRIELFARQSTDLNWDYWGNETEKFGTTSRNEEEVAQIRAKQIEVAELCKKCVRVNEHQVDAMNKFGLERNGQRSLDAFFKK